jgi:hypothetical protein
VPGLFSAIAASSNKSVKGTRRPLAVLKFGFYQRIMNEQKLTAFFVVIWLKANLPNPVLKPTRFRYAPAVGLVLRKGWTAWLEVFRASIQLPHC